MNIYDFDHTIYPGDSTLDFWRFCLRRHPGALLALPGAVLYGGLFRLGLCSRERFKEQFYRFLRRVPDAAGEAERFWDKHFARIYPWYRERRREDDVIVSASPEFLIRPAGRRLGVETIASRVSPGTGELLSPNCRGEEKVVRLRQVHPEAAVEEVYSDSRSDAPLARLAVRAYLVQKGRLRPWPDHLRK